ncbi:cobalt-zinc-cadmium efflux system protein [Hydrogenivirga caldilitoris]|uniref:Cobalt-zinc-cadmium efflux system protein n=1 Tax=Hydrogenivirga caldilitoris TaxID=246264 RepID=A0A497XSU0_9AQUI|nr:cation diffusion facilitator family transporter [Hydrogenivirga caldilitoris]RLJ71169.1 cobalt-zinc-cadmium efflux system protein [Hydrogenivirga caldilitoris]
MDRKNSVKVLGISLALVFSFALVELVGGFLTNSLALLSDAGHMLTDSVSLLIALIAQLIVQRARGKRMTFGLYRLEVVAALMNGIFLIGLIGYIAYEAFQRFLNPEPVLGPQMLAIAGVGLLINLMAGYMLFKSAEENINIKAAFLHVVTDTLGSIAAIIAGIAVSLWKFYLADPILSVAISLLILPGAYTVIKDSLNVLLELVPSAIDPEEIEEEIRKLPGIIDVHDLHVWSITSGNVVLTAHVVVSNIEACNDVLKSIEEVASRYGINHTTIQVEREGYSCPPSCPLLHREGGLEHHHHHH